MQGIDLNSENEIIKALKLGLKDINTEKYHKFCSNLYIVYVSVSPLGESVGLNSLGSKLIYCSEKKVVIEGISLEDSFEFFKKEYCEDCKKIQPREPNWKCTMGWFDKRWQSDMIQNVLKKRYG